MKTQNIRNKNESNTSIAYMFPEVKSLKELVSKLSSFFTMIHHLCSRWTDI